jgi:hypothetical protein
MLNKNGKEGKTSWDSFSYFLQMGHNVYSHIESVQRANALTDVATTRFNTSHHDWRKVKANSKEDQFDPWVPRNALYMSNFIDELFKSETPMQMLDEASAMMADFNGQKSLKTSNNSMNGLFKVSKMQDDVVSADYDTEAAEQANTILNNMEA